MTNVGRLASNAIWLCVGQWIGGAPELPGEFEYSINKTITATTVDNHTAAATTVRLGRNPREIRAPNTERTAPAAWIGNNSGFGSSCSVSFIEITIQKRNRHNRTALKNESMVRLCLRPAGLKPAREGHA